MRRRLRIENDGEARDNSNEAARPDWPLNPRMAARDFYSGLGRQKPPPIALA